MHTYNALLQICYSLTLYTYKHAQEYRLTQASTHAYMWHASPRMHNRRLPQKEDLVRQQSRCTSSSRQTPQFKCSSRKDTIQCPHNHTAYLRRARLSKALDRSHATVTTHRPLQWLASVLFEYLVGVSTKQHDAHQLQQPNKTTEKMISILPKNSLGWPL